MSSEGARSLYYEDDSNEIKAIEALKNLTLEDEEISMMSPDITNEPPAISPEYDYDMDDPILKKMEFPEPVASSSEVCKKAPKRPLNLEGFLKFLDDVAQTRPYMRPPKDPKFLKARRKINFDDPYAPTSNILSVRLQKLKEARERNTIALSVWELHKQTHFALNPGPTSCTFEKCTLGDSCLICKNRKYHHF